MLPSISSQATLFHSSTGALWQLSCDRSQRVLEMLDLTLFAPENMAFSFWESFCIGLSPQFGTPYRAEQTWQHLSLASFGSGGADDVATSSPCP